MFFRFAYMSKGVHLYLMLVFSHLNDLQKIVIRADLIGEKCKSKIMSIVAKLEGTYLPSKFQPTLSSSLPNV